MLLQLKACMNSDTQVMYHCHTLIQYKGELYEHIGLIVPHDATISSQYVYWAA